MHIHGNQIQNVELTQLTHECERGKMIRIRGVLN